MLFLVQPTPAEINRSCAAIIAETLPPSRGNLLLYGTYAVVGVLAAIFTPSTMWITIAIAVGALTIATILLQHEASARVQRARDTDPHTLEPYQIEVGADGIRAWCAHVDTRYNWSGITVKDTPEFLLFLRGPGGGVAVPKRLLAPDQLSELKEHIRTWAPIARIS